MRQFFLTMLAACFVGVAHSAPQGYNYQVVSLDANKQDAILQQFLQEFAQQQQQQQQTQQLANPSLTISANQPTDTQNAGNNDYQFANQLPANTQQLTQYEQQLQQLQAPQRTQQLAEQPVIVLSKPVALQSENEIPQRYVAPQREDTLQVFKPKVQTNAEAPPSIESVSRLLQQQTGISNAQPVSSFSHDDAHYNKEFFYLNAPQEDYVAPKELQDGLAQLKKNIRVLFIKGPEQNGLTNAALQLAKQSLQQQTAIYVLNKQYDAGDLASKFNEINSGNQAAKPVVTFVKYRTPAEAENAQRTIQAQYEALNGPNSFNYDSGAQAGSLVDAKDIIQPRNLDKPADKYLPTAAKN